MIFQSLESVLELDENFRKDSNLFSSVSNYNNSNRFNFNRLYHLFHKKTVQAVTL